MAWIITILVLSFIVFLWWLAKDPPTPPPPAVSAAPYPHWEYSVTTLNGGGRAGVPVP